MRALIALSFFIYLPLLGVCQEENKVNERVSIKTANTNQTESNMKAEETQPSERVSVKKKEPKKKTVKSQKVNARTSRNKED
jgi:hypothetical protein